MSVIGTWVDAENTVFRRESDGKFIPADLGNNDYQEAMAAVAKGDTIADYVAPPATLPDLQPYQFRAMLAISGKADALNAYIASLPTGGPREVAQAKLDYSLIFQRKNDLVLAAQAALGLSDADLDAMWTQAAAL